MARTYAGILGPLAFLTSLIHGLIHARPTASILLGAWCSLLVFAVVGCIVGWIAQRTVDESVIAVIEAELTKDATDQRAQPTVAAT